MTASQLAAFATFYALFHVAHGIADYWVQSDWQAQNKNKNPVALWTHASTYGLTFVPFTLLGAWLTGLPLAYVPLAIAAIFIPHGLIDNRKLITWFCAKTKGWRPDNQVPWPVTPERLMDRFARNGAEEAFVVATRADLETLPLYHGGTCRYDGNQFAWVEDEQKVASRYLRVWETDKHKNGQWSVGGWGGDFPALRPLNPWEIAIRLHVTIALDQQLHKLCLMLVALALAVLVK